jgi:hypothetical protein
LLENAGLVDTTVRIHPVDAKKEPRLLLRRYGYGNMIGSALRALVMYTQNPAVRASVKGVREGGVVHENVTSALDTGCTLAEGWRVRRRPGEKIGQVANPVLLSWPMCYRTGSAIIAWGVVCSHRVWLIVSRELKPDRRA